jgi:hypothetical protein
MNRFVSLAAGVALAMGVQSTLQAGMSYFNVGYYGNYAATVVAQGQSHSTYATAFSIDWQNVVNSDPLPPNHTDPFVSFCLDVNAYMSKGWWRSGGFSDVPLNADSMGADRQELGLYRAASLYMHYAPGILSVAGDGRGYIWTDAQRGAALQLAIWEVLYETTGVFSIDRAGAVGNPDEFYVSSVDGGVRSLANQMLASQWNFVDLSLETTFWNAVNADGTARSSQDLIGPISAVPEASTIIAGALLLLPFLFSTIRRRPSVK